MSNARLRVSTLYQTTANQERELREIAGRMDCKIVKVYKDHGISGADDGRICHKIVRSALEREPVRTKNLVRII